MFGFQQQHSTVENASSLWDGKKKALEQKKYFSPVFVYMQ